MDPTSTVFCYDAFYIYRIPSARRLESKHMPRKMLDSLIDDAQRLVESGSTVRAAARVLNVSEDNLSKHLRARGVHIRKNCGGGHNRLAHLPEAKIIIEYLDGASE